MIEQPRPSWRKPFGMLVILGLVLLLAIGVSALATCLAGLPPLVQLLVYLVAGLAWITPLKPLLAWMERGGRQPRG